MCRVQLCVVSKTIAAACAGDSPVWQTCAFSGKKALPEIPYHVPAVLRFFQSRRGAVRQCCDQSGSGLRL